MHTYSNEFLIQKAYEVSYALFRVAYGAKGTHPSFANRIEEYALDLLDAAIKGKFQCSQETLSSIVYTLKIGSDVGVISSGYGDVIAAESEKLNAAIEYAAKNAATENNPAKLFSKWENNPATESYLPEYEKQDTFNNTATNKNVANASKPIDSSEEEKKIGIAKDTTNTGVEKDFTQNNQNDQIDSARDRKYMILERIRQNGNCRVREIQEVLPEVSERTIRYDLQKLLEDGEIERVGVGGPAIYYKPS